MARGDNMTVLETAPKPDFKRDRYNRPLIVPAAGGKPKPYTRASGAAKPIEDRYNLELWGNRNIAFGLSTDASLVARVLAIGGTPHAWDQETKKAVNAICEDASKVALSHKAADIGTALHRMVERINLGEQVDGGMYQPDLDAYRQAVVEADWFINPELVECRLVCDELEMAGTCDLIIRPRHDDQWYIADLKTGTSIDFGGLGYSAQLAAYAHSDLYDVTNDTRPQTPPVSREVGYIIYLPAGQGVCTIHQVDLVAGYKAAQIANQVRRIRTASKRWITPIAAAQPPVQPVPAPADIPPSAGAETLDTWEPACLRFAQTLKAWDTNRQQSMRSRWPVGVPTPKKIITGDATWDRQHVFDILNLLDDLQLPFIDNPFTTVDVVDPPTVPEIPAAPKIDDGGPVDPEMLAELLATIKAHPSRDTVNAWLKEAADAGCSWSPRLRRTDRSFHIARAAFALAQVPAGDRTELLDVAQPGVHDSIGVALSRLTIDQACTLQQMCDAYNVAA
jgi:hypothetical protein